MDPTSFRRAAGALAAPIRLATSLLAAAVFALAVSAEGETLYVAGNGLDAPGCGPKASPCRSIGRAMASAMAGDQIVVGPGMYGDLNRDQVLGGPGEEDPASYAPGCGCMVAVNKPVVLTSSDGAAATLIEGKGIDVPTNVLLITDGGVFGKPGKGFTVTDTAAANPTGIGIDSNHVSVAGNQVIGHSVDDTSTTQGTGIGTVDSAGVILIAGNQVFGWLTGIHVLGTGKTVRANVVVHNLQGIVAEGTSEVVGNVINGNHNFGLGLGGAAHAVSNDVFGSLSGVQTVSGSFSGSIEKNNVFGNAGCGLDTPGVTFVQAPDNYWGAPTGPGPAPANASCSPTAIVTPFATKPFKVKARIKP